MSPLIYFRITCLSPVLFLPYFYFFLPAVSCFFSLYISFCFTSTSLSSPLVYIIVHFYLFSTRILFFILFYLISSFILLFLSSYFFLIFCLSLIISPHFPPLISSCASTSRVSIHPPSSPSSSLLPLILSSSPYPSLPRPGLVPRTDGERASGERSVALTAVTLAGANVDG